MCHCILSQKDEYFYNTVINLASTQLFMLYSLYLSIHPPAAFLFCSFPFKIFKRLPIYATPIFY